MQVRFSSRHFRDDYRSAAAVTREVIARGETVWWAADESTGMFYGVPFAGHAGAGGAFHLISPNAERLQSLPPADMVVLSKPDVYDLHNSVSSWLAQQQFTRTKSFQSFDIFERR
jgi:hypothetical protein